MDGIDCPEKVDLSIIDINTLKFVEVKVNLKPIKFWQRQNYAKVKLRNWWSQCFLVGIHKIIVGERNEQGIVECLEELEVKTIPKIVNVLNSNYNI